MAHLKPDFTFNDTNRAIIRFNRECVVEIEATPDRNTVTQYGFSIHINNELIDNEYGFTGNLPIIEGPDMPEDDT